MLYSKTLDNNFKADQILMPVLQEKVRGKVSTDFFFANALLMCYASWNVCIALLPFNCLYTTSSSELSLFSSTSWLVLGPCAVPLPRGLFPSAAASGPTAWTLRVLHLAQKVINPATASTFSTSKTLHLLNTKAIKKSPVSGLRILAGGTRVGESPEKPYRCHRFGAPLACEERKAEEIIEQE